MAHLRRDKKKLLHRVRRLRGQLAGIEKALEEEKDCAEVLQTLAACRGALNGLLAEIIEGHIRFHLLDPKHTSGEQLVAAGELLGVVRAYLK